MPPKARPTHAAAQQAQYDELAAAISRVLFPVMICMALSVYLVHSLGDESNCETRVRRGQFVSLSPVSGGESDGISNPYEGVTGIIFIAIFVCAMVLFTFVLLLLYKYGCTKIIFGWLLFSVSLIFMYVGGTWAYEFCRSHCINVDWVTLVFVVWNFSITGLFAIFSTVPRLVNQAYLIIMSSLMAYIFRRLPEWTAWTILGLLVVWDLFAVLTPWGPLRMLVKIAQDRGDPLPALVYDTNPSSVGRDADAQPAVVFMSKDEKAQLKKDREARRAEKEASKAQAAEAAAGLQAGANPDSPDAVSDAAAAAGGGGFFANRKAAAAKLKKEKEEAKAVRPAEKTEEEGVGTLGRHLKLGLGDFVFYSLLVAVASRRGAMTAVVSFIAILTGLCATLFLVTVYRKALPALPISIVLGALSYIVTRELIQPFADNLLPELIFH